MDSANQAKAQNYIEPTTAPAPGGRMGTRARLIAVGASFGVLAVWADLLPQAGALTPPGGGFGIQLLWFAVALVAAWRPLTARFAWVVVLSAAADVVTRLNYVNNEVAWLVAEAWSGLATVVFAHLIVSFPTGVLRDRFDRSLVLGLYGLVLVLGLARVAFWQNPIAPACTVRRVHVLADPGAAFCPRNPFQFWPDQAVADGLAFASNLLVLPLATLVVVAVARHWRAGTFAGRRVLLPVVLALPFAFVTTLINTLAVAVNVDPLATFLSGPVGQLMSWVLPGTFLVGVARAQLARGAVGELALRLGSDAESGGLREAVASALGDPTVEILFPAPSGSGWVDRAGMAAPLPARNDRALYQVDTDGRPLAALVYDSAIELEDPGRVQRVAAIARLAIDNERLTAQVRAQLDEVQASRARIVQAADDERRRVERDLHDGAQQRLVALAMRLQLARETMASVPALVDATTVELQAAISEVRSLARGLHPTILTEAGLAAGIEALAEQSAVPVRVSATDHRFAPALEAAAYFVVAEALTNVGRYSCATRATVSVKESEGEVEVVISDDGRGGADPEAGTGLRGLADRVAALGGSLSVVSPPGGGTTIVARLPVA